MFNLDEQELLGLFLERKSIRTYDERPLEEGHKEALKAFSQGMSNPFGAQVRFVFLEGENKDTRYGTYGVIRGAVDYVGALVKEGPLSLEGLGYELEMLMLKGFTLGIGSCWLGGTFKREDFKKALNISKEELFPAVSPLGYPRENKSVADHLVRFLSKGNARKNKEALFFSKELFLPLEDQDEERFGQILEMVRLAPSASNKQPWRLVISKKSVDFYEAKTPGYSEAFAYDLQRLDLGIAACHFHLGAQAAGISGDFQVLKDKGKNCPQNMHYLFSYVFA